MARPATLKLALLLGLVLVAHAATLEWLARHREPLTVLQRMAPPMYTRLLQPKAPEAAPVPAPAAPARPRRRSAAVVPAVPAAPAQPASAAAAPVAAASAPAPTESPTPAPAPAAAEPVAMAEAPAEGASAARPAASAPEAVASAPDADPLRAWPTDTQLSYQLSGNYRGEIYGNARVQWQRAGSDYQVRVQIDIHPFLTQILTSQGEVTPQGLLPRAYEEVRPGGKRRAALFGNEVLSLENGKTAPRPDGMQDTASQFVELAQRFATGRERLEVGQVIEVWLARPGAVDRWTYDVVEREVLRTPRLGAVEAFRLKPRPLANPRGNITAEMWFAPSLQYLPVRIKVVMGDEAHVDLLVDRIEQR